MECLILWQGDQDIIFVEIIGGLGDAGEKTQEKPMFAILPAFIRHSRKISPKCKLLYAELSTLTDKFGRVGVCIDYLSFLMFDSKQNDNESIEIIKQMLEELQMFDFISYQIFGEKEDKVRIQVVNPVSFLRLSSDV